MNDLSEIGCDVDLGEECIDSAINVNMNNCKNNSDINDYNSNGNSLLSSHTRSHGNINLKDNGNRDRNENDIVNENENGNGNDIENGNGNQNRIFIPNIVPGLGSSLSRDHNHSHSLTTVSTGRGGVRSMTHSPPNSHSQTEPQLQSDSISTMECGQCLIDRPLTASHCYECGLCVDKLDHHCPVS